MLHAPPTLASQIPQLVRKVCLVATSRAIIKTVFCPYISVCLSVCPSVTADSSKRLAGSAKPFSKWRQLAIIFKVQRNTKNKQTFLSQRKINYKSCNLRSSYGNKTRTTRNIKEKTFVLLSRLYSVLQHYYTKTLHNITNTQYNITTQKHCTILQILSTTFSSF